MEPEAEDRTCHKGLQEQFFLYIQGYIYQNANQMKRAIMITVPDFDEDIGAKSYISSTEMSYILLYLQIKNRDENTKKALKACLDYIERHFVEGEEKVKVYPKAVCQYCEFLNAADLFERVGYCKKALSLLTENGRIQEIPRLLELLGNDLEEVCPREAQRYRKQLWALTEIYKTYQVEMNKGLRNLEWVSQDISLLNEILKIYRQEKGFSREEASEEICDVNSYGRIENGTRGIKKSNYDKLAERLEIPYGKYSANLVTDNYECLSLARQGSLASKFNEWDKLEKIIQKLKKLLDLTEVRNKQYILERENLLLNRKGKITPNQFNINAKNALHLTMPRWNEREKFIHFYSKEEIILINQIAVSYRMQNKSELAKQIVEGVYSTFEKSTIELTERAEDILLLLSNWKNFLTDLEEYDKAMEKAEIGVRLSLISERGDKLDTFVFEKGWCGLKKECNKMQIQENLEICLQAYYMCDLFGREYNKKATREFLIKYGMEIDTNG
ncbi:MAG: helix-turn-helix transcriptional regulator [Lachnospiraceae bacterium]|nr:helix-turn-helix transcriptional regulator [Lachnospiraceae bacterium]